MNRPFKRDEIMELAQSYLDTDAKERTEVNIYSVAMAHLIAGFTIFQSALKLGQTTDEMIEDMASRARQAGDELAERVKHISKTIGKA